MKTSFAVVGGGIVGLAIAARLSQLEPTILLERHPRFIHETSSRNSGVIHAGMYYPTNSLKTKLCMEGNANMWRLVSKSDGKVTAKRTGKWIGATHRDEYHSLQQIVSNMQTLGIEHRMLTKSEMRREEPNVAFQEAVFSPNTGIVDVSTLSDYFQSIIQSNDGMTLCNQEVAKVFSKTPSVLLANGDLLHCHHVVCCVGLSSEHFWRNRFYWDDEVREKVPFPETARVYFCKGRYVGYRDRSLVKERLIYPCPLPSLKGLGVHSVHDIGGNLRFGPDATFVDDPTDLSVNQDEAFIDAMHQAVLRYIPTVQRDKMFVDFAGMRPKLSGEGMPFRDFSIQSIGESGDAGTVTFLSGIESPGLTSCTAIADYVAQRVCPKVASSVLSPWAA